MGRKSKAKFELKGHTLPGINQKSETPNLKDGRSPSSAFQMESPMKEVSNYLKGATIDPMAHKDLSGKIPAFSDFISTDTQGKLWDKFHEKRAKKRKEKEFKELEEAGGGTLDDLKTKEEERRKKLAEESSTEKVSGRQGEVKPENEMNIGSNASSYGI